MKKIKDIKNTDQLLDRIRYLEGELKNKSEEVDRLKNAFLANISHEIRTPMNAIMGFSGLLTDPSISEDDKLMFIEGIMAGSKNLLQIIESIVHAARLENMDVILKQEEIEVNNILKELLYHHSKEKSVNGKGHIDLNLQQEFDNKKLHIKTDAAKLRQILNNLIDNALKFTEKGKVKFGYRLPDKETIEFFVEDSGIGIPKDKIDKVFDKFSQIEESRVRKYSGLGVGLTISRDLIKIMGGDIRVDSEKGKGTNVTFTLPLNVNINGSNTSHTIDNIYPGVTKTWQQKNYMPIGQYSNPQVRKISVLSK